MEKQEIEITEDLKKEIERLHEALINTRMSNFETRIVDHDSRLRPIEEAVTKFNFMLYMTAGGGLLSILNLVAIIYLIVER